MHNYEPSPSTGSLKIVFVFQRVDREVAFTNKQKTIKKKKKPQYRRAAAIAILAACLYTHH